MSFITTNRMEGSWGLLRRNLHFLRKTASKCMFSRKFFPFRLDEFMWRINHCRNRLEAETYQGDERRCAAMMRQIVADMGSQGVNTKRLLEDIEVAPDRAGSVPRLPYDPTASGHGRSNSDTEHLPLAA